MASRLLLERGTLGRSDLRESGLKFPPDFLSSWGGIFFDLVYQGDACHCEPMGTEGRFAGRRHWLPELEWSPPDVDCANLEIARRYFHAYGPASLHDLAYWRGVRVGEAAAWIKRLGNELVSVRAEEAELWMPVEPLRAASAARGRSRSADVRLLGRFDPLLLAHRDKSWIVPDAFYSRVWRPMGHIEGTMIRLDSPGPALGTWRYDRSSRGLVIELRPFEPLAPELRPAFEGEAQGVADYFSLPLERVRFKTAGRKLRSARRSPRRREAPSPPRSSRS